MNHKGEIPFQNHQLTANINYHLLVIAINRYPDRITNLNNAIQDAKSVRDSLVKLYQFQFKNCISLFDEEATLENIYAHFDQLTNQLLESDCLVIYFSGHGLYIPTNRRPRGYWLTSDSISGKRHTYLPNFEVKAFLKNLKARHVFTIIDACFAGTVFRGPGNIPFSFVSQYKSRYVLTSGRHQLVEDGPPGQHSPFCQILLNILDQHSERRLWAGDICRKILRKMDHPESRQLPRGEGMTEVGHDGGDFAFLKQIFF